MNKQLQAAMMAFAQAKIEVEKAAMAQNRAKDAWNFADNAYYRRVDEHEKALTALLALTLPKNKK